MEELKGANPGALTALVKKYAPAAGGAASGSTGTVEKGLEGFVSSQFCKFRRPQ